MSEETNDAAPAPPAAPPIAGGRSLALGCAGFAAFFVVAAIAAAFVTSTGVAGAVFFAVLAVLAVAGLLRGSDARRRAVLARLAIGFAIGAVVFGGCLVLVADGLKNMH